MREAIPHSPIRIHGVVLNQKTAQGQLYILHFTFYFLPLPLHLPLPLSNFINMDYMKYVTEDICK
jgi:hypothetical protein